MQAYAREPGAALHLRRPPEPARRLRGEPQRRAAAHGGAARGPRPPGRGAHAGLQGRSAPRSCPRRRTTVEAEYVYQCGAGAGLLLGGPLRPAADVPALAALLLRPRRRRRFARGWNEHFPQLRARKWQTQSICRTCNLISLCGSCPGAAEMEMGTSRAIGPQFCEIAHIRALTVMGEDCGHRARRDLLPRARRAGRAGAGGRRRGSTQGGCGSCGHAEPARARPHPDPAARPSLSARTEVVRFRVAGIALALRARDGVRGMGLPTELRPFACDAGGGHPPVAHRGAPSARPTPRPALRLRRGVEGLPLGRAASSTRSARRPSIRPSTRRWPSIAALQQGVVYLPPPRARARCRAHALEFPLDELLFQHRFAREGAAEVHACGLLVGRPHGALLRACPGRARPRPRCCGSASGRGCTVLSDDRIVLASRRRRPWAYGTPWHGEGAPLLAGGSAPGRDLLPAPRARDHASCRWPAPQAAARLFARTFPPLWDRAAIDARPRHLRRGRGAPFRASSCASSPTPPRSRPSRTSCAGRREWAASPELRPFALPHGAAARLSRPPAPRLRRGIAPSAARSPSGSTPGPRCSTSGPAPGCGPSKPPGWARAGWSPSRRSRCSCPLIERLAAENGVADRVRVVRGDSRRVALPREFDLLVSETVGNLGFDEGILPIVADARSRFLRPRGRVIPEAIALMAAPAHEGWRPPLRAESFRSLALHIPREPGRRRVRLLAAAAGPRSHPAGRGAAASAPGPRPLAGALADPRRGARSTSSWCGSRWSWLPASGSPLDRGRRGARPSTAWSRWARGPARRSSG